MPSTKTPAWVTEATPLDTLAQSLTDACCVTILLQHLYHHAAPAEDTSRLAGHLVPELQRLCQQIDAFVQSYTVETP